MNRVVVLVVVCVASFLAMVVVMHRDPASDQKKDRASTFNFGPIGHAAAAALLEASFRVERRRTVVPWPQEDDGRTLLVLAEPDLEFKDEVEDLVHRSSKTLLILPKWVAHPQTTPEKRRFSLVNEGWAQAPLEVFDWWRPPVLRRKESLPPGDWDSILGSMVPFTRYLQVVVRDDDSYTPLLWSDNGDVMVFSVVFDEAEVVVVTDPDIMANHGIARGANADLWLAIIGQLLPEGGTVVFDETIHGLVAPRHLLVALTRPPLMLVGVQLVLLLCALLWAGNARFGGLLPREAALGLGKGGLIDNIANLHAFAGHGVYNLRRYLDTMVHDVAARLGAPVEGDQQRGVLARREELLGIGGTLQRLRNDAGRLEGAGSGRSAARLVAVARSIHQWHEEMLDGPGTSA